MSKYLHILAKPVGPLCNLNCEYCFYTEKQALFPEHNSFHMSDTVLETFISKYIASCGGLVIPFVWQGGEPTLLGLEFFKKAVALQQKYANGKKIANSLQTNGVLLNDEWCEFLKVNNFLVGLSLDGPEEIHDRYRVNREGQPSFHKVMQGLELLKAHQVVFNVLSCVTKESSKQPLEVYQFFKNNGAQFIQFIPIVERQADTAAIEMGLRHATLASLYRESQPSVTEWSVEPEDYGDFLIKIFDEWVRHDVGSIHVMNFEWALEAWLGIPASVCVFAEQCGTAVIMEHNGDIYSCDHYVYPEYRLGNLATASIPEMMDSEKQRRFGQNKTAFLPQLCKGCEVEFACHGECPKHRFLQTADGERGLNYLCAGYKKYFRHIHPYMKVMRKLIENDLPAAQVKEVIQGPLMVTKR